MGGGANKESLVAYQRRSTARWPLSVQKVGDIERDPAWRPFETADAQEVEAPTTGLAYFESAGEESPDYYWRR